MPRESYHSTQGASKESAGGKLSHRECLARSRMPRAKGFETPVVGGVGGSTQIQGGFILALRSAQGSSQSKAPLSRSRAPGWLHWSINQMPAALVPRTPGGNDAISPPPYVRAVPLATIQHGNSPPVLLARLNCFVHGCQAQPAPLTASPSPGTALAAPQAEQDPCSRLRICLQIPCPAQGHSSKAEPPWMWLPCVAPPQDMRLEVLRAVERPP